MNDTPPPSVLPWLSDRAPAILEGLRDPAERPLLLYLLTQILGLTVATPHSAKLQPFSDFKEVSAIPGVSLQNPNARIFVADGAEFSGVNVVGATPSCMFVGSNAIIRNSVFALEASENVAAIGFGSRVQSLFAHALSAFSLFSIAPGVTTEKGCDFFAQEGSYIVLGEDCMLSTDISIMTSDSHGVYDRATGKRLNAPAPVIVGRHVWIGRRASLGKGAHVGEDTVIGQQSIVTKKLDPHSVYGGVPARMISSNTTWDRGMLPLIDENYDQTKWHFGKDFASSRSEFEHREPQSEGLLGLSEALACGRGFEKGGNERLDCLIDLASEIRLDWGDLHT